MTESFGPHAVTRPTPICRAGLGSCGKPSPAWTFASPTPILASPAPGDLGMIQLRGPHTLRGICRRSRDEIFTADGFYPTGDLGRLDDEGFLFYHGRSDDMFKVSGATVYPSEVECALRTIAASKMPT